MDAISYSRALKPPPATVRISGGERRHDSRRARFSQKKFLGIRSIIFVIVNRSSSAEVCDVHSRSLEASRSRVGIAEWDDIR